MRGNMTIRIAHLIEGDMNTYTPYFRIMWAELVSYKTSVLWPKG